MISLSNNSMKILMECMEAQNNVSDSLNLAKCCFRLHQVVQNDFHRKKSSAFAIELMPITQQQPRIILRVYVGKLISEILEERRILFEKQTGNSEQFDSSGELNKIIKVYNRKHVTHKVGRTEKTIIDVVKRAFTDALEKVRSISTLILTGIKLDSQFLEMLKTFSSAIRELRKVELNNCVMEWTSDELMIFLKLFDDLKELYIYGIYGKKIVTDKHLSLVSEQIIIINMVGNVLDFPGITPKICEHWLKKGMKRILLNYISTELSFSDVSSLAEQLQLEDLPNEQKKVNFGTLKCSDEDFRQIILSQRRQKTEWTIEKSLTKNNLCRVSSKDYRYNYQFSIDRPYNTPDFANLLTIVRQIREDSEKQEMTVDNWKRLNDRVCGVGEILQDYQRRRNIPAVPAPPHLPRNARGRAGVQAFANFCEEVILLRMRQLEELQAQEMANAEKNYII